MTKEDEVLFNSLVSPLIKFMNEKLDPHHKIIINQASAEILSGIYGVVELEARD